MKQAVVWGLGVFGGGVAVARRLTSEGYTVRILDQKTEEHLASSVAALKGLEVELILGRPHRESDFEGADLVVKSPAVPPSSPWLAYLRQRGVPITSELLLGLERLTAPFVMITGSKGKSTTTALLGAMLAAGAPEPARVVIAGNNERPLLAALEQVDPTLVVLEVSSFMAAGILESDASIAPPQALAFTSLSPEHLNWHTDLEDYYGAKLSLLRLGPEHVVFPDADAELRARVPAAASSEASLLRTGRVGSDLAITVAEGWVVTGAGERLFALRSLQLLGDHNVENALTAAAVAVALGTPAEAIARGVAGFGALEHRLEPVGETAHGVRLINDSTATTPEAATAALRSVPGSVVLLAGGSDKGADYEALGVAAASATAVVCLGEVGERIAAAVEAAVAAGCGQAQVIRSGGDFDEAFHTALERCEPGGSLLLSPAAASYDMFKNFKARGERFRTLARAACV